jgi:hypothetical protein
MSLLGHTETSRLYRAMSALPSIPEARDGIPKACQLATLAAKPAAFSTTVAQSARRARSGARAIMVSIIAASRVRWIISASANRQHLRAMPLLKPVRLLGVSLSSLQGDDQDEPQLDLAI